MDGLFRSRAFQWSAIFWILSAAAAHQGRLWWEQSRQAEESLLVARERARTLDGELKRLERLVASVPQPDRSAAPAHERVALLVGSLRKAEPRTRVAIQNITLEGGGGADRRDAGALLQPIASFPGAGSTALSVEGSYLTRYGLEGFLAAGRDAGASLAALSVQERRFQATFRLYGRL